MDRGNVQSIHLSISRGIGKNRNRGISVGRIRSSDRTKFRSNIRKYK